MLIKIGEKERILYSCLPRRNGVETESGIYACLPGESAKGGEDGPALSEVEVSFRPCLSASGGIRNLRKKYW